MEPGRVETNAPDPTVYLSPVGISVHVVQSNVVSTPSILGCMCISEKTGMGTGLVAAVLFGTALPVPEYAFQMLLALANFLAICTLAICLLAALNLL